MTYLYRTMRVPRDGWRNVIVRGERYGVWAGEVGFHNDEGAVMTIGDAEIDGALEVSDPIALAPTLRPADTTPPAEPGLYVHRWFEIAAAERPRFLELTAGAWPGMEAAHPGVRIIGLWAPSGDDTRLLLITRYVDHAQWERSRYYAADAPAAGAESRELFRERAGLTRRTIARFTRLVSA
jgi:hypothetical protein